MLLRASGEIQKRELDVEVVADPSRAETSGVRNAGALLDLVDALVERDDEKLFRSRVRVLRELGPEALVDAVAVASNFERMVRIADATGIPLDDAMEILTADLRRRLGIERFTAAVNTRLTPFRRLVRPLLRPVLRRALHWMAARAARRAGDP